MGKGKEQNSLLSPLTRIASLTLSYKQYFHHKYTPASINNITIPLDFSHFLTYFSFICVWEYQCQLRIYLPPSWGRVCSCFSCCAAYILQASCLASFLLRPPSLPPIFRNAGIASVHHHSWVGFWVQGSNSSNQYCVTSSFTHLAKSSPQFYFLFHVYYVFLYCLSRTSTVGTKPITCVDFWKATGLFVLSQTLMKPLLSQLPWNYTILEPHF